jgi:hypothetical protein
MYSVMVPVRRGLSGVEEYRAFFVGHDGHFNGYEPLTCPDDTVAIDLAKRMANRHGIELWSGARLVTVLPCKDDRA